MSNQNPSISAEAEKLFKAFKRAAKFAKKSEQYGQHPLAWHLDRIAKAFGYNNWSQLHKHAKTLNSSGIHEMQQKASDHSELAPFLEEKASVSHEPFDEDAAKEAMRAYVKERFTPLNDFAYYDSESETGFAWPEVELEEVLQEAFSDDYPIDLINEVATELFLSHGYWGLEDYGRDKE